jgi:competence protein ComEC
VISKIFHRYNFLYVALCFIAVLQAQLFYTISQNHGCQNPHAMVSFLNIGQGDAIYIQDTTGKSVLIDTGPKDDNLVSHIQQVTGCVQVHIDTLLLTHPDADHIGEAKKLVDTGLVTEILHNGFLDMDQPDETLMENELEKTSIVKRKTLSGDTLNLQDIHIDVLYPFELPYKKEMATTSPKSKKKNTNKVDDNVYSTSVKITFSGKKEKTFLLTGDAPVMVEEYLIKKYSRFLQSDVLKLGHHGSKSSSGQSFLSTVSPEEVVVSAGKNNRYNHPNEDTMERVYEQRRKKPLKIRETFVEGDIVYDLEL